MIMTAMTMMMILLLAVHILAFAFSNSHSTLVFIFFLSAKRQFYAPNFMCINLSVKDGVNLNI